MPIQRYKPEQIVTMARGTTLSAAAAHGRGRLTQTILALAAKYGRYGYRRITVLLRDAGWTVGNDRVQRISTPRTKNCPWGPRYGDAKG